MDTTLFYKIIMGNLNSISLDYSQIGSYVFASCYRLTTVSFPECTSIGANAFCNCCNLTTISFPECVSIGFNAFGDCSNLTTVSFPKCTTINGYAFHICTNLSFISFPKCSFIGSQAFYFCKQLSQIYLTGSSVPFLSDSNAFSYTPISNSSYLGYFGSIYVPSSLVTSYKTAENWSIYSSRIVGI